MQKILTLVGAPLSPCASLWSLLRIAITTYYRHITVLNIPLPVMQWNGERSRP